MTLTSREKIPVIFYLIGYLAIIIRIRIKRFRIFFLLCHCNAHAAVHISVTFHLILSNHYTNLVVFSFSCIKGFRIFFFFCLAMRMPPLQYLLLFIRYLVIIMRIQIKPFRICFLFCLAMRMPPLTCREKISVTFYLLVRNHLKKLESNDSS